MRSSRCGGAGPGRTVPGPPRLQSTDLSTRSPAPLSSSSISPTGSSLPSSGGAAGDQRADLLAADDPIYVGLVAHVEDVDRQVGVPAERERGGGPPPEGPPHRL